MKCLNCLNFMTAHAFLTSWYLFTLFTVAPIWCTPSVILDFCFILLFSNTVIWVSLAGTHRSKLEVKGFIFHVVVFSRETFHNLVPKAILRKLPWHRMIMREMFTWFDSSIAKQSKLIYAMLWFSIMADLSDKYYTVFEYPKKIFHRPKCNCS